jgi:endonuclease/exonuclease/phosphatase family metal-dependent hydrolase
MAKTFHIATFNAENLLHPGVYFAGRDDKPYPEDVYDEKVAWITRTLREGQVDLVGFQELFSEEALKAVTQNGEYNTFAPDIEGGKNITKNPTTGKLEAKGPFVGLATKFKIVSAKTISEFPASARALEIQPDEGGGNLVKVPVTRFQRPVIQAEIELKPGVTATVFVAHLKSKRPQFLESEKGKEKDPLVIARGNARSLILRAAESVALRTLIVEATQGNKNPVILFGDLNDDLGAVTTQVIAGDEPYRFAPPDEQNAQRDRLLYSVHDIEEAESYRDVSYSHIFNGRYELLDHIFVSQELSPRNRDRIATVRHTRIFNDHLLDERRVENPGRGPSPRSDHGIPVTEIAWPKDQP